MIGTMIVCPACDGVAFTVKNDEGDLLLHCNECTHKAVLKKAGVQDGTVMELAAQKYLPKPREKKPREKKVVDPNEPKFVTMSPTLLDTQKMLVTAALHACKEIRGIEGRSFAGTSLYWIAVDFMSGVDVNDLSPKTRKMYEEALKANEEKEPVNPEDVEPELREAEEDTGEGAAE